MSAYRPARPDQIEFAVYLVMMEGSITEQEISEYADSLRYMAEDGDPLASEEALEELIGETLGEILHHLTHAGRAE